MFLYIVQLLNDEYGAMSPGSLEAQGLISASEYQKVAALTQSASPDAHKKIAGKRIVWDVVSPFHKTIDINFEFSWYLY